MPTNTHAAALLTPAQLDAITSPASAADFLADDAHVAALARAYAAGTAAQSATRGTYLRILLAHVQKAAGAPRPTLHNVRRFATLGEPATLEQLKALKATHEHLYGVVLAAVTTSDLQDRAGLKPDERRRRAYMRNVRSNFARSAASTLRLVLRAGYDVHELGVKDASKGRLAALARKRNAKHEPADNGTRRAALATARAMTALELLAGSDHAAAIVAGQTLIDRAAQLLLALGQPTARTMDKAAEAKRPLRTGGATFWPIFKPDGRGHDGASVQ